MKRCQHFFSVALTLWCASASFAQAGGRDKEAILARIEEETASFGHRLKSAEAREAFTAFMEKRPADFSKLA